MVGFEILRVSERAFSAIMKSVRIESALYNKAGIDGRRIGKAQQEAKIYEGVCWYMNVMRRECMRESAGNIQSEFPRISINHFMHMYNYTLVECFPYV